MLESKVLNALYMDEERYGNFQTRCSMIFRNTEPVRGTSPVPVMQANAAWMA
jgi:hypothetical protein